MDRKVFLLDGATGTELWNRAKKDGVAQVPVWIYNMEHPDYVKDTIRSYVEAGSDIVCANTFGALNRYPIKMCEGYVKMSVFSERSFMRMYLRCISAPGRCK